MLAVFEGARADPELAALAAQLVGSARHGALAGRRHHGGRAAHPDAVDDLWLLMDPAVFDRLVRQRGWSPQRYDAGSPAPPDALLFPDGRNPT